MLLLNSILEAWTFEVSRKLQTRLQCMLLASDHFDQDVGCFFIQCGKQTKDLLYMKFCNFCELSPFQHWQCRYMPQSVQMKECFAEDGRCLRPLCKLQVCNKMANIEDSGRIVVWTRKSWISLALRCFHFRKGAMCLARCRGDSDCATQCFAEYGCPRPLFPTSCALQVTVSLKRNLLKDNDV